MLHMSRKSPVRGLERKQHCQDLLEGVPERKGCWGKSGAISWTSVSLSKSLPSEHLAASGRIQRASWADLFKNMFWDSAWPQPHFRPQLHSAPPTARHSSHASASHPVHWAIACPRPTLLHRQPRSPRPHPSELRASCTDPY